MPAILTKPAADEYAPYYDIYIGLVPDGDVLKIYGRLRFGRSDLGVNKARVEGWLAALEAG